MPWLTYVVLPDCNAWGDGFAPQLDVNSDIDSSNRYSLRQIHIVSTTEHAYTLTCDLIFISFTDCSVLLIFSL